MGSTCSYGALPVRALRHELSDDRLRYAPRWGPATTQTLMFTAAAICMPTN